MNTQGLWNKVRLIPFLDNLLDYTNFLLLDKVYFCNQNVLNQPSLVGQRLPKVETLRVVGISTLGI